MRSGVLRWGLVPALAIAALACGSQFKGGGDLRAKKVVLKREVEGIREIVARLERGEPMLPLDDVAISIDDTFVRDLVAAQLPFDMDVDRFHLSLKEAAVKFAGSPVVRLRGALRLKERPDLEGTVEVLGALEGIEVDGASSTLRAKISVDHLGIEKAAGIEKVLSGATLDEVARRVRLEIKGRLPSIRTGPCVTAGRSMLCCTFTGIWIGGSRSLIWRRTRRAASSRVDPARTRSIPAAFSIPM